MRSAAPALTPAAFAGRVEAAAHAAPKAGWFGDQKVFISHAHAAYETLHGPIPLAEFKARLLEARRAGALELGRADLVDAMKAADVRGSATPYLNAVYHFVRTAQSRGGGGTGG